MDDVVIEDKPGARIHGIDLIGARLIIRRCAQVELVGISVRDAEGHGILIEDCPGGILTRARSEHNGKLNRRNNRVGHGLLMNGNCDGFLVHDYQGVGNVEDGIQHGNEMQGLVTYHRAKLEDNGENGIDLKGGSALLSQSWVKQSSRGEPLLLHNSAVALYVIGSEVIGHRTAPMASVQSGSLVGIGSKFLLPEGREGWFRDRRELYGKDTAGCENVYLHRDCELETY